MGRARAGTWLAESLGSVGDLPMLKPLRQSGDELGDLRPLQCFFHRRAKIDTKSP